MRFYLDEYEYGSEIKFEYNGSNYTAIERIYSDGTIDIEVSHAFEYYENIPDDVQEYAEQQFLITNEGE